MEVGHKYNKKTTRKSVHNLHMRLETRGCNDDSTVKRVDSMSVT